jgi:hypothetical protein
MRFTLFGLKIYYTTGRLKKRLSHFIEIASYIIKTIALFIHHRYSMRYRRLFLSSWYGRIVLLACRGVRTCGRQNNRVAPVKDWQAIFLTGNHHSN